MPSGKSSQPGRARYPMAGNNKSERICVAGLSHRPCGAWISQGLRQLFVCSCLSVWDFGNALPYGFLESGPLFHKWRSGQLRKFSPLPLEEFSKQFGTRRGTGHCWYVCHPEAGMQPLFCHFVPFRGKGEMDRKTLEANHLAAYFPESIGKGTIVGRVVRHRRSSGDIWGICIHNSTAAFDKRATGKASARVCEIIGGTHHIRLTRDNMFHPESACIFLKAGKTINQQDGIKTSKKT